MLLLAWTLLLGLVDTTSPLSVPHEHQQQQQQQQHEHLHQQQLSHQQHPQVQLSSGGSGPNGPKSEYIVQKNHWNGGGGSGMNGGPGGSAAGNNPSEMSHSHIGHSRPPPGISGNLNGGGSSEVQHRMPHPGGSNDTTYVRSLAPPGSGSPIPAVLGGTGFSSFFNRADWTLMECFSLRRTHHLYYQIGNGLFFLAFLAPNGPFGMLWLRCVVIIGCVLMIIWGWQIECTMDVVVWAGLFLLVNAVYVGALLCKLRPVKFEKEIEAVYVALFKPLRVSRHQFKKVLNCMKLVRSLKYQEIYAQEKVTKVDSLSLVLSGKLVVSQNQKALHIVFPHQFLDSPEWFGVSTDDYFQVSIMAMEESRVLIWHRDKLKLSIMAEPFLQAVFDHILGRDVVKKLMQVTQVSETMAQSNGYISAGYGEDAEDKPMLTSQKSSSNGSSKASENGGHGITALINRQLQALPRISKYYYCAADPNAWRLGRIDETDHETAV
ncbi:blood vessel epicardial substance isoform X2 [Uranotaenia lowii]|uniref:blood vessel epicardial substance isoform X2 n=1 Tax=Uranotaenia lowii TaxID=190385 RepID=UPI002479C7AE|nr:blood vessel epicardial substance isoform X2 [Uranotaenia lowii]